MIAVNVVFIAVNVFIIAVLVVIIAIIVIFNMVKYEFLIRRVSGVVCKAIIMSNVA